MTRGLALQVGYHRAGDPEHDPARCPLCKPRQERRQAFRGLGEIVPLASGLARLQEATSPFPVAPLEVPAVELVARRFQVGGLDMDQDQARALWAQLGELLGLAEQDRRPRSWSHLRAWMDREFQAGTPSKVREIGTRLTLDGIAVRHGRRVLVRLGIFQVAHLRQRRAGTWTGPIADYFPGTLGVSDNEPDAHAVFTPRRVSTRGDLLAIVRDLSNPPGTCL